ncbi:MAG: hypothetical protein GF353_13865 [Candidatus Lokiarchaeota archaeon]|nr:hypothetical protein [Candidatus Lokiarchaeota archaeon]
MKALPACITCIRSGFLCNRCEKNLESGKITDFELDLAKFLVELEEAEEKFNYLRDISFYKALDYEDVVILVVGRGDKLKITSDLIDLIKETYEIDKLILVEKSNKPRPVIESIIVPSKVISLNEIFLATGDVEFKALLRQSDRENFLFTKEELEDIILELTGKTTRIEFQ